MSTHSEEPARELPEKPDLRQFKDQAKALLKAGQAPTPAEAAPTAAKTAFRWLRWAAVPGFVYLTWSGHLYAVVPYDVGIHACPLFVLVAAGAKIAPRYRLAMALVLAAVLIQRSFWGHLLANQPPWVTSYQVLVAALQQIVLQGIPAGGPVRHFLLETLGAGLGVVYIFGSERAQRFVTSAAPAPPPS
jgi:hypothetical protein